jgi:ubiquinone/menaquinone biosynthesis C-methylase UbiE
MTAIAPAREATRIEAWLDVLRCPQTRERLVRRGGELVTVSEANRYPVNGEGIPLFAEQFCSDEGRAQQAHYDRIAEAYVENLHYPHTQEYMAYLDQALLDVVAADNLGTVAEICCGRGEAFQLIGDRIGRGIGIDVSVSMLRSALTENPATNLAFVQGDATMLPVADESIDSVFMLGGIHHVNDRVALFSEVKRVLKPGGRFYFREPVSDLWLWRLLRGIVYRLSPALDSETERPLRYNETVPFLDRVGLKLEIWRTHGLLGFCLFMNSDVLVVNRLFRFIPGIRGITRFSTRLDARMLSIPGFGRSGLQVIGVASKPGMISS